MPADPVQDTDLGGYRPGKLEVDLGLKHYLEIGAGIASLYEPLHAITPNPRGSLLDVGCGFGFLVDLWGTYPGCCAEGIELASYGHWGRELLGINISHAKLSLETDGATPRFDLVFAGEVLEHVPDPTDFLRKIASRLNSGGVFCLTTPDAAAISPSMPWSNLLASLSPGAHQMVLSEKALRKLLLKSGWEHIVTTRRGDRLIAWASDKPLSLSTSRDVSNDPIVVAYLERLSKHSHVWLKGGALYRLFREAINSGSYDVARQYGSSIESILLGAIDSRDSVDYLVQTTLATDTQDGLIGAAPCYAGPYLFYRGMLELNSYGNYATATHCFTAAARICTHWIKVAPTIATEHASLIESSLFHARLALEYCTHAIAAIEKSISPLEGRRPRWYKQAMKLRSRLRLALKSNDKRMQG